MNNIMIKVKVHTDNFDTLVFDNVDYIQSTEYALYIYNDKGQHHFPKSTFTSFEMITLYTNKEN